MGKKPAVAYFCMEYALDNRLQTYAGGLGILAGDYMKGATDEKTGLVGLGIRWKQGYGEQVIDPKTKMPYDAYRMNPVIGMEDTGIRVTLKIKGRDVTVMAWKVTDFGVENLYLLDTDVDGNDGEARWITGQLYGWFGEERVAQEMVLGIGGVRVLRALGYHPEVYHFNEGHALLAGFELIREKQEAGDTFEEARAKTRRQIVFTTHTPVIEGNESHPLERLAYMGANLGLTKPQLRSIGGSPFNMTVGALRLSRVANAVSALHAETANRMWADVKDRCEIIGITNAIHLPTWVDEKMLELADAYDGGWNSATALWERHAANKKKLVRFIRERTGVKLDPDVLLIGFSRRAVPYKRSNFIFTDRKFIAPLLKKGKLQIVFSGKAHPFDDNGRKIVAEIVGMAAAYPESVVFLENYDMEIGHMLTRGSDIWLNNPRRPKEASGTSGMKASMNGVLNLSILDGWWPEACVHGVNGWQFGDGFESTDADELDKHDFKALKKVLRDEVLPTYYDQRERWIRMMAESVRTTREPFAMKRMLAEYEGKMYKRPD